MALAGRELFQTRDVIEILNQLAEKEAELILRRHRESAEPTTYTEISDRVSREINANYARFFDFFEKHRYGK